MDAAARNGAGTAEHLPRPGAAAGDLPLDRIPPFQGLPAAVVTDLERRAAWLRWRCGTPAPEVLTANGHLFVVRCGRVGLLGAAPGGHRAMVAIVERGAVHSTLGEWPPPEPVALMDTIITAVPAEALRDAAARFPRFAVDLAATLSDRVGITLEVAACLGQTHLEDRLWARLLTLAGRIGVATPGGVELRTRLTHAQWALLAGGSRESVTLAFGRLRRAGRLRMGEGRLVIPWAQFSSPAAEGA